MGAITSKELEAIKQEVGSRVDVHFDIEPSTVKELADGVFEAVITTSAIDRGGESILTAGIDTANYMNNPIVLYGHNYEGLPIGKTLKLTQLKNKIKAQFQLAVEEYPFARTVAAMIKGGFLNATSIGGLVKRWSEDYKTIEEMEMVEFSVVPVPANQEALMTARALKDATGKDPETIKAEFEDYVGKVFVDKLQDMPQNEVKDAIKLLKNLLARLEETVETADTLQDAKAKKLYVLKAAKEVAGQSQKIIVKLKR